MGRWSRVSGEVSPESKPETSNMLPDCLLLVTVLAQFRLPQVCADFSNGVFRLPGKFNVTIDELNSFSKLVLPSWLGQGGNSIRSELSTSLSVLDMTANRSCDLIQLGSNHVSVRSYEEWHEILHFLAESPYWEEVIRKEDQVKPVKMSSVETNTELLTTVSVGVCTPVLPLVDGETQVESSIGTTVNSASICCTGSFKPEQADEPCRSCTTLSADRPTHLVSGPVLSVAAISPGSKFVDKLDHLSSHKSDIQDHHNVPLHCSWCHRRGHQTDSCWRRQGLCLICGSSHQMRDCPRYIPPLPLVDPVCSSCGGPHLGKYCRGLLRRRSCCHWCGRFGHSEGSCWEKAGCCLICGSSDHVIPRCPGFRPKSMLPIFPPWCLTCGSHHVGTECSSPYIE